MISNAVHPRTHHVKAARASTFLARLRGLMFREKLRPLESLLLSPCRSVHTCFMRFPIDIVFLDGDYRVVGVVEQLPPWRVAGGYVGTQHVLELAGGSVQQSEIKQGDRVIFS